MAAACDLHFWPDKRVLFTLENLGWEDDDFEDGIGIYRDLTAELKRRHVDGRRVGRCVWQDCKLWTDEGAYHSPDGSIPADRGMAALGSSSVPWWVDCFAIKELDKDHPAFDPASVEYGLFTRVAIEEGVILPFPYCGHVSVHSHRMDRDKSSLSKSK